MFDNDQTIRSVMLLSVSPCQTPAVPSNMARSLRPYGPGAAQFSSCGTWRYMLSRDLSLAITSTIRRPGLLLSIGLNPSTATGENDDPTIHKESSFAIVWGYALYLKANAYSYRATEPDDMFAARDRGIDIVGPDNDAAIRDAVDRVRREGGRVLAAWGQHIDLARQRAIAQLLIGVEVVCVAVNKDGSPSHPLYKRGDNLQAWTCPVEVSAARGKSARRARAQPPG